MADHGATIRLARAEDIDCLPEIEVAAGVAFRDIGLADVADDAPPSVTDLLGYQADGRCWVAMDGGPVVGYLIAEVVDGNGHIEQVSVHPDVAGRGLGRRLMQHAEAWAEAQGLTAMTLTTFVEVPWNGPYYQRLGYRVVDPAELTPGLVAIRASERAAGLDRWPRAVMRKPLTRL